MSRPSFLCSGEAPAEVSQWFRRSFELFFSCRIVLIFIFSSVSLRIQEQSQFVHPASTRKVGVRVFGVYQTRVEIRSVPLQREDIDSRSRNPQVCNNAVLTLTARMLVLLTRCLLELLSTVNELCGVKTINNFFKTSRWATESAMKHVQWTTCGG